MGCFSAEHVAYAHIFKFSFPLFHILDGKIRRNTDNLYKTREYHLVTDEKKQAGVYTCSPWPVACSRKRSEIYGLRMRFKSLLMCSPRPEIINGLSVCRRNGYHVILQRAISTFRVIPKWRMYRGRPTTVWTKSGTNPSGFIQRKGSKLNCRLYSMFALGRAQHSCIRRHVCHATATVVR